MILLDKPQRLYFLEKHRKHDYFDTNMGYKNATTQFP